MERNYSAHYDAREDLDVERFGGTRGPRARVIAWTEQARTRSVTRAVAANLPERAYHARYDGVDLTPYGDEG